MGLEPTSSASRHLFSRQVPHPAGWLPYDHHQSDQFRGLESNQRPPRSERSVTTNSNCPGFGKKDSNLHHLVQSQEAFRLADSRERPAGVEPASRTLVSPRLCRSARDAFANEAVRDPGVEPGSPGWKPGVVPLDQSRNSQTGGRRGSRTLKAVSSSDFESDAVTHRLALPKPQTSTGGRNRTSNRRLNRAPPYRSATPVSMI